MPEQISKFYPVQVMTPPIGKQEREWSEMMLWRNMNKSWQYQNGGVWPFIGSFYAMALKKIGKTNMAWQELGHVAQANQVNNWQFNEWFHGKTGKPMGMPGQSWNAGTFLLAYHYLKGEVKV